MQIGGWLCNVNAFILTWYGRFNRKNNWGGSSSYCENAPKFFYVTEISQLSAIIAEWPCPGKCWWKGLSDFNKITFYQCLYQYKRKRLNRNMIKTLYRGKEEIYSEIVLGNMSSGLLHVFVELGNLHRTSNYVLYWIHRGHLFWFCEPQLDTSVKYSCIITTPAVRIE